MPRESDLQGLQFNYETPRTYSANLYRPVLAHAFHRAQAAYVFTQGADLQGGVGYQNVTRPLLPSGIRHQPAAAQFADFSSAEAACPSRTSAAAATRPPTEPAPTCAADQARRQFSNGLTFLLTYTWSKTMSDAGDLLNGGVPHGGLRAFTSIPGLGPRFDWARANFDIRNVIHFSGGYELPVGKGKRYLNTRRHCQRRCWAAGQSTGLSPPRADSR